MTVREAFEKYTEAFNSHDIDGFASTLGDDVIFRAPGGIVGEGKSACAQFFGGWLDAFPDARVEIHDLHITGDVAVEEGTFTGTHQGVLHAPYGDIPATGRPVTLDYIQVLRYRDGKHIAFNLMYDQLPLLDRRTRAGVRPPGIAAQPVPADHGPLIAFIAAASRCIAGTLAAAAGQVRRLEHAASRAPRPGAAAAPARRAPDLVCIPGGASSAFT